MTVFQTAIRFIQINKQNISDKEVFFPKGNKSEKEKRAQTSSFRLFCIFLYLGKKNKKQLS